MLEKKKLRVLHHVLYNIWCISLLWLISWKRIWSSYYSLWSFIAKLS